MNQGNNSNFRRVGGKKPLIEGSDSVVTRAIKRNMRRRRAFILRDAVMETCIHGWGSH